MDRVNGADWVDIGGGKRGFRSQNAGAGIPGTEVTAAFLNNLQEELLKVIETAGLVANDADRTQLWQALNLMLLPGFGGRLAWMPVLSVTTVAPPGAPSPGDAYIVPAGATGPWAGQAQKLAIWTGVSWALIQTKDGLGASLPDGRLFLRIGGVFVEFLATTARYALTRLASQLEVDKGDGDGVITASSLRAKKTKMFIARASITIVTSALNTLVTPYTVEANTLDDTTVAAGIFTVGAKDAGVWDFVATAQAMNQTGWIVGVWVHDMTRNVYHGGPGYVPANQGFTSGTISAVSLQVAAGEQYRIVCAANGASTTLPIYLSISRRNG